MPRGDFFVNGGLGVNEKIPCSHFSTKASNLASQGLTKSDAPPSIASMLMMAKNHIPVVFALCDKAR